MNIDLLQMGNSVLALADAYDEGLAAIAALIGIPLVAQLDDECVKTMFGRMVASDGEVSALCPFKRLGHLFVIGRMGLSTFDPENEKRQNNVVRDNIRKLIERVSAGVDAGNERALCKTLHYVAALDRQLAACDRTDQMIDALSKPIGRRLSLP